jgi:hypothetical protein
MRGECVSMMQSALIPSALCGERCTQVCDNASLCGITGVCSQTSGSEASSRGGGTEAEHKSLVCCHANTHKK